MTTFHGERMKQSVRWTVSVTWLLLASPASWAQSVGNEQRPDPQPVGIVARPCPPAITPPPAIHDLLVELFIEPRTLQAADIDRLIKDPQFRTFEDAGRRLSARDWPGICRYSAANDALMSAGPAPRLVFMGDSITENWALADPTFFERGVVNRGISGQTTAQMLVRFRADVVALHPKVVHILGGTNDVAGNTGPSSARDFENNIMAMVEIARANGIRVVLGSVPPTARFNWQPQLNPVPTIRALNAWLRDYAVQKRISYIDYYALLTGSSGELRADLGNDGVHPNRVGYGLMRKQLEKQIAGLGN
jgi:lysophospholipase L1-like esterase